MYLRNIQTVMWKRLLPAILILLFLPCALSAQEAFSGKVVSVDRENNRFVMRVEKTVKKEDGESATLTVKVENPNQLRGLEPGSTVTVWTGEIKDRSRIIAKRVSMPPNSGFFDRTGVRSRLNRSMGMGKGMMRQGRGRHGR